MARNNNEEKKAGKLQWVLFVIVIPIVFAITMLFVVLSVMGINPMDQLKEAPVVSSFVDSKDEEILQSQLDEIKKKTKTKTHKLRTYRAKLAKKKLKLKSLKMKLLI